MIAHAHRASEHLLESLDPGSPWTPVFEQARIAVALLTADFRYRRVNQVFAAAEGRTPDDFAGKRHFELYPQASVEAIFRRVVASGQPHVNTARPFEPGTHPRRGVGCWDWSLTPVAGDDGRVHSLILMLQDVTARIRAEERARRTEADTRTLLGLIPGLVYRAGVDGAVDQVLDHQAMVGYDAARINALPEKWLSLVHPDDRARVRAECTRLRDAPARALLQYRIVDPRGELRWVEDRRAPLTDGDGRLLGFEGLIFDVTERELQAQQAREIEEHRRRQSRSDALLECRLRLAEMAPQSDVDRLLQTALDDAERLTASSIGFFHFVDADQQQLTLNAWSTHTLASMCTAAGKGSHYPVAAAGVWADCLRTRQAVIHNDYAALPGRRGLPEGHAPVIRELTVPVSQNGRIVAVIGVGNKATDYDAEDVDTVTQLATLAMDVIGRRRAEIAQHESETRYRHLFESMTSGFALHEIIVDADGRPQDYRFIDVNPAFEAITGLAAAELLGRTVREVLPHTEASWIERYGDIALTGDPAQFEDFSSELGRWYRVTAYRPQPGQFAVLVDDVTRSRRNEDSLREAAAVFEHTGDGIVITDAAARILAINRAYSTITGYAEDEVLGRNPRILQSSRHDADFYRAMWSELAERHFWQGEVWDRRKNGEIFPIWLTLTAVRDDAGTVQRYIGVFTDIGRIKAAEARADYVAYHDALTGLPNRTLLNLRFQHALDRAQRRERRLGLILLDLDFFKNINDTLGHDVGDRLLVAIAERFRARLRAEDTLARLGGDEFAVLIEELDAAADAAVLARALLEELEAPFDLGTDHEIYIGASIGISVSPEDGADATLLLRNADAAVYLAKSQGRNTIRFYTGALTATALERVTLESRLRKAIEQGQLVLHFQPLVEAIGNRVIGAEALVRWQDPAEGLIPPFRFIPVAEDCGLIAPLGAWVLHHACTQMKAWLDAGRPLRTMAVNISPRQFVLQDVPALVAETLEATGLAARFLELEITEGTLMEQGEGALATLARIRELGVRLSIDDFGTGYSSLSYLKRFPIDKLKIDRSFVSDISTDSNDAAIATTIIAMARSLNLSVLAEGVETREQLQFLEQHGCDYYQGYLFGRPVPAAEFPESLS